MTRPDEIDNVDDQLRAMFERHADDAPRVDLTSGTIARARRIRTRRRVASGAAVLVAAAVGIPVGNSVLLNDTRSSDIADKDSANTSLSELDDSRTASEPVDVSLSALSRGDDPTVPYIADGQLMQTISASSVPGAPTTAKAMRAAALVDAAAFTDGTAGWLRDPRDGSVRFDPGTTAATLPSADNVSQPAVDHDGSVAWAANGVDVDGSPADLTTIFYTDTLRGGPAFAYTELTVKQVTAVSDAVALFNATTVDGSQVVGRVDLASSSSAAVEQPWPQLASLTAASPAHGLIVGRTITMTSSQRPCLAMLSYDDASELWRTCDWVPQEFSVDGSRVYAIAANGDGFGPREVAVLDARSGQVVEQLTTPGTFGRATFEDTDTIDIVTVEAGKSAIVRCGVAGTCELATEPRPAAPDSLVSPYQLAANP